MNKIIIALTLFVSATGSFAYNFDDPQAQALDELSQSLKQRELENRIAVIESKSQSNDLEQFAQELHDNAGDI